MNETLSSVVVVAAITEEGSMNRKINLSRIDQLNLPPIKKLFFIW
jgi:hypothetical protein